MNGMNGSLGVAMIGAGFMGAAHSQAWAKAPQVFELDPAPVMRVLVARERGAAMAAAARWGWEEFDTDWHAVLERDDIDVVDICAPGALHAEIAVAALNAGKHVLCEKPLANTLAEAVSMAEAAARAATSGVRSMVAFNYRRVPALALARKWIADGRLGQLYQVRAAYRQDWAAEPDAPLVWRMQRKHAGSGALGDIGSHIVDLAQFLLGDVLIGVSALSETFIRERPLSAGAGGGTVDVDDCTMFSGRFRGGTLANFEATRFAVGRKNALGIEISGSEGSLRFDLEALNELRYYDKREAAESAGFRRVLVTEAAHPYLSAWWPAGHIIGWEHAFTHQAADFIRAVGAGDVPQPSFADGLQVQCVLDAIEQSARSESRWTPVPEPSRSAGNAA